MLLFFPKPYSQETLLSFIYRVAREHEMSNLDWIFELIAKKLSINVGPERINWLMGDDLKSVAEFLGITWSEAKKLTVYHHFERNHLEVRKESKNVWFLYKKTRFCPLCLQQGYQRKSWINCHSIMCVEHSTLLLDSCNNCCNIPNTKSIILDECAICNNKLSNSPIKANFPNKFIEYQQIMNQILKENTLVPLNTWIQDPATFLKALDFLALWAVKMIPTEEFSIPSYNMNFKGNILERNHLKNYRTVEQAACLYSYIFQIFNNWPREFNDFIKTAEKHNDEAFRSFIKYGIPRSINTSLWEISRAFTNYVALEKGNLTEKHYLRSDEVRFIYPKFNGSIANSSLIKSNEISILDCNITVINKEDLESFMDKFENSYTKEELREIWGTSAKATYAILKDGHVEGAFWFKSGSAYNWVIPKSSISFFEKLVKQGSIKVIDNPTSLNEAVEWIGPNKAHLLIRNILNGSIKYTYESNKISDLILDKRDLYFKIREDIFKSSEKTEFISFREVSFLLGIKKSDIQHWIKSGRFGGFDHEDSDVIPFQNFMDFHNRFITTLELAIKFNLQIKQVIKKYTLGKLISISGPQMNDGKRLLFLRQQ
ncbi:TniQ family protein [Mesobacillus subterraneus]|uniref:TniQ family protein n=1 Tax=Mesobacillus subterraneus TaxID=285983 RepID=UPI00204228AB|nr:TniQ family protein [Mesobacillus subterraneus]MCM3576407.1 TniQ family protein [Mesobacillus subterraneus]